MVVLRGTSQLPILVISTCKNFKFICEKNGVFLPASNIDNWLSPVGWVFVKFVTAPAVSEETALFLFHIAALVFVRKVAIALRSRLYDFYGAGEAWWTHKRGFF